VGPTKENIHILQRCSRLFGKLHNKKHRDLCRSLLLLGYDGLDLQLKRYGDKECTKNFVRDMFPDRFDWGASVLLVLNLRLLLPEKHRHYFIKIKMDKF